MSRGKDSELTLGLTQKELREQVIERAAEKLRDTIDVGDYGHLNKIIQDATNTAVSRYIEKTIVPMLEKEIASITFQATNEWGERNGKSVTFREYLVQRAERWIREEVNYDGKPKGTDGYSWKGYQTRVAFMIHKHLHYSIEHAIEDMLKTANASIVGGIEQTVKMKLAEIQTAIKVTSQVKS